MPNEKENIAPRSPCAATPNMAVNAKLLGGVDFTLLQKPQDPGVGIVKEMATLNDCGTRLAFVTLKMAQELIGAEETYGERIRAVASLTAFTISPFLLVTAKHCVVIPVEEWRCRIAELDQTPEEDEWFVVHCEGLYHDVFDILDGSDNYNHRYHLRKQVFTELDVIFIKLDPSSCPHEYLQLHPFEPNRQILNVVPDTDGTTRPSSGPAPAIIETLEITAFYLTATRPRNLEIPDPQRLTVHRWLACSRPRLGMRVT